jgi:hypothetical protein
MRKKARIIAKLAAKYRALAFFVNGSGQKPASTREITAGFPRYYLGHCFCQ